MDKNTLKQELLNLLPNGASIDEDLLDAITGGIGGGVAGGLDRGGIIAKLAPLGVAEADIRRILDLGGSIGGGSIGGGNIGGGIDRASDDDYGRINPR